MILVHARARGKDPLDITSFHPEQMFWGPGRNHWALMPHKLLFRLECKGFPVPTYYVENMMHNGRVVLDGDNHPVKDYCNIPKTLASNADAYLLEAIGRMDTRITQIDFRARMPLTRLTGNGAKALGGLSTIGQRMRRFRVKNAIPPWKGRENSENFKDYVRKLLSPEGVLNNSTEELDGLTRVQEDEVFHLLKGQHLVRAGSRALTPGTRRERHEADEQRTARLRAAAGDTVSSQHVHPGHGQKRKNISLESSEDDDELKPYGSRIKRVRPNVPNRFEQLTDREARRGRLERIVQPPAATTVKRGLAAALQTDDDGRFHVRGISPFKAKLLQFPHNGEHFELDGSHRRRTHAPSTNPFHEHPSTLIGTDAAFYGITFDPFQHDNQLATADSISSTNFGNQFISEGNTIGNSQEVLPYLSAAFDRTKAGNVIEEQLVEEDFSLHESPKFDFEPNAATRRLRSIPNDSDEIANLGTHPTEEIPDIQDSGDFFQFELDGTTQISDYDNNKFDREATKTALQTAREQYSQLLQIDAPLINPGASFDEQLKFLQDDLASRWHDKNVPSLTRIQQQPGFECKIGPELKSAEEARTEQTKDDSLTIPDDFLKALDDLTKDSNFLESDFFL